MPARKRSKGRKRVLVHALLLVEGSLKCSFTEPTAMEIADAQMRDVSAGVRERQRAGNVKRGFNIQASICMPSNKRKVQLFV